ncbi:hypothetical protein B4U80_14388, partial [Leptotrombidium deliense]
KLDARHIAALRGHCSILSILLNNEGGDLSAKNHFKQTPLHRAIESWDPSTIKLLMSKHQITYY